MAEETATNSNEEECIEGENIVEYDDSTIDLLPAQTQFVNAIVQYPNIQYFFFIGGYGSGKSTLLRLLTLILRKIYDVPPVLKLLVGGTTLGDIQKFVLTDLYKILVANKVRFKHDKKHNLVYIKSILLQLVNTEDPSRVYGHSCHAALLDEVDELKPDIVLDLAKSVKERLREPGLMRKLEDGTVEHRKNFMAFFTTTQGKKRGLYQLRAKLREQGIPYVVVKGKTSDNKFVSEDYVESLKAIYTEEEQKAFLYGEDMDFSSGLVYADFDTKKNVVPDQKILPDEVVYIGQDKNIGYNKSVCKVIRDGILHTVKVVTTKSINHVPATIRAMFPTNPLFWYPDASALEIIGGYAEEIRKYNISLQVAKFNPSILQRVFIVNKMYYTGRSVIWKSCKELINAHDTRGFNDLGMPEKPGGENCPSHVCDADEYVTWRIVMANEAFKDIREASYKVKG